MCKLTRFRFLFSLVSMMYVFFATGCGSQTPHPNQFNTFDGAAYDSLTLARGALTSLRAQVSVSYPKYAPVFNEAAVSYATTYNAYALYRTTPADSIALNVAIANLTVSVVALENSFQADMQASPATVADVRRHARSLLEKASRQHVSVSNILTELEIAAAIARSVPATQAYAGVASMVIEATSEALSAEAAQVGQPIELTTIQPVSPI